MQFAPSLVQQRLVRDGLRQRVLEFVGELFAIGALDEEAGALEAAQRLAQLVGRHVADTLEQRDGGHFADGGKRLQHVLVGARQPIDAGGQHRAHRRRNRDRRRAARPAGSCPGCPTSSPDSTMLRTYSSMNSGLPPLCLGNSSVQRGQRFVPAEEVA